ncbi:hypothetical protein GC387_29945 [Pseudomonas sp. MWU12-2323]|nr:hypothetical protein [Pseudomonas sp. MWU12-2323]POZ99293.1 hypothetical protein C4E44_35755 [Pseudomonas sp. MWU12-2312b]
MLIRDERKRQYWPCKPGIPTCRSRLAGDSGRLGDARLTGLIASKPAPTGLYSPCTGVCPRRRHN